MERLCELLGESLALRLVVLSACETSLPGTDLPDEVVSLLRRAQQWLRDTTNDEKLQHYERARAAGAPWLPDDVHDDLIDEVAFGEPGARDHAGMESWAAFTYVGC